MQFIVNPTFYSSIKRLFCKVAMCLPLPKNYHPRQNLIGTHTGRNVDDADQLFAPVGPLEHNTQIFKININGLEIIPDDQAKIL